MGAEAAWDDWRTIASWRRDRRVGRTWLTLGFACLALFLVIVTRQANHADWLVTHGAQASGVVLEDPPQAIRCGQVPVPVRFNEEVHTFYVDGCGGGGLSKGDVVTVDYDPAKPDDFTLNGAANEHPLPTFAAIVGLVAGCFLVVGACVRTWRLHRLHQILRHNRWQPAAASIARYPSSWTRGRWIVRLTPASPALLTQASGFRELLRQGGTVEFAGAAEGPAALRDTNIDRIVLARRPRSRRYRTRATRVLNEQRD